MPRRLHRRLVLHLRRRGAPGAGHGLLPSGQDGTAGPGAGTADAEPLLLLPAGDEQQPWRRRRRRVLELPSHGEPAGRDPPALQAAGVVDTARRRRGGDAVPDAVVVVVVVP